MIDKEILIKINEIDIKNDEVNDEQLIANLELLEKAHSKIYDVIILARMKKLMREFGERESDIYVATYPRSGSTLMQMIVYQMITDGNMDFKHLYDVSPWYRYSAIFNKGMPSTGKRRIVKTHDEYKMLSHIKKGKFIFVVRDCLDVISSIHQHIKDYSNPDINFEELCDLKMRDWFEYNKVWMDNKNGLNILFINFEDVINKKKESLIKIAEFLEIELNDEITERIIERTSVGFMKKNESKFGEQHEYWKAYNNFIRKGQIGDGMNKFTDEQINQYWTLYDEYGIGNKI